MNDMFEPWEIFQLSPGKEGYLTLFFTHTYWTVLPGAPWPHLQFTRQFQILFFGCERNSKPWCFLGFSGGLSGAQCVCVWVSVSVCVCVRRGRDRGSESPLTTWISPLMLTGLDINNVAFHSPHPPLRSLPRTHTYALFLSLSLSLVFTVYFSVCVTVHVLLFVPIHKEMAL